MATRHINASPGDFADTVLLPGDPLRARYIAEKFLVDPELVTDVRNMYGYTGLYRGKKLSVMGSGMGIPSASIYCSELIEHYSVKNILRAGSCGAVNENIALRDIVIALGACTDSNVNRIRFNGYDFAAVADYELLSFAVESALDKKMRVHVGNIFSADLFYTPDPAVFDVMEKYNILGVEMEAAGIYGLAAEYGARALAICTVSDHIRRGEELSAADRQTSFDEMIELALDTAAKLN